MAHIFFMIEQIECFIQYCAEIWKNTDKPDFIQRNVTKMSKSQENTDFQLKAEI